jgi:hypothetical protein
MAYFINAGRQIARDESNFVLVDYGIIIELQKDAIWGWRSAIDRHGTTMNAAATYFPDRFKAFSTSFPQVAQWTEGCTIPKALYDAAYGQWKDAQSS